MNLPKGISFDERAKKYRVRYHYNGTKIFDKRFSTLEEAIVASNDLDKLKEDYAIKEKENLPRVPRLDFIGIIQYAQLGI